MSEIQSWRVAGSYYETCNCEAVCPCRRMNGVPGGRSTYGICQFVLSWRIREGHAAGVDLSNLLVSMAGFYNNDEKGAPWSVILYIDARADDRQFEALRDIYLGRVGGNLRWPLEIATVYAVKRARISLDHTSGKEEVRVDGVASANALGKAEYEGTVTCAIPGHDHVGQELVCDSTVTDGPLNWSYRGRCGFATDFDYFR
jgi:hypothetical protein